MFAKIRNKLSGMQMIAIGFFLIILAGSLLLLLPFATKPGETTSFLTALFTAASATCVTGLVVVDTFTHWTVFGQLVILTLIQIGGLGFITLGVTVSIILRKKIGLKQRGLIQESLNVLEIRGTVRLTKRIIKGTILFEGIGAFLLAACFIPRMGFFRGLYNGVFHSISAFCNAGFDLMGRYEPFSSLTGYYDNPVIVFTISALIIIGGIGFFVWGNIMDCKFRIRKFNLHTKMVLSTTLVLLAGGTVLFYLIEDSLLFADMTSPGRFLSSFFCSVTPRTAGFNTVDISAMSDAGKLLLTVLMFIGGAPGSTAGGVKVTTLLVLILYLKSTLKRSVGCNIFGRRLADDTIQKASAIFCTNLFFGITATIAICALQDFSAIDSLLEVFSAIGTVGMSAGLTTKLNTASRLIIIFLMYIGRLGSLSFAMSFTDKKKIAHVMQPVERINIG